VKVTSVVVLEDVVDTVVEGVEVGVVDGTLVVGSVEVTEIGMGALRSELQ